MGNKGLNERTATPSPIPELYFRYATLLVAMTNLIQEIQRLKDTSFFSQSEQKFSFKFIMSLFDIHFPIVDAN